MSPSLLILWRSMLTPCQRRVPVERAIHHQPGRRQPRHQGDLHLCRVARAHHCRNLVPLPRGECKSLRYLNQSLTFSVDHWSNLQRAGRAVREANPRLEIQGDDHFVGGCWCQEPVAVHSQAPKRQCPGGLVEQKGEGCGEVRRMSLIRLLCTQCGRGVSYCSRRFVKLV